MIMRWYNFVALPVAGAVALYIGFAPLVATQTNVPIRESVPAVCTSEVLATALGNTKYQGIVDVIHSEIAISIGVPSAAVVVNFMFAWVMLLNTRRAEKDV